MTFSIVARSVGSDGVPAWGVAVASKFLAVGNAVPAAVAGIGAVATQADANVAWKGLGLALLDEGATADAALKRLLEDDDKRDHRQIGIVDVDGNAVTYTGAECFDWAGGVAADGVAVQGNILAGPEVVEQLKAAWDAGTDLPIAHRLLAALAAGDDAGGDKRGRQSAALLVVREGSGYGGLDDVAVDLRVDDHTAPITELKRLLDLNDFYLTAPEPADRVTVTSDLRDELERIARAARFPDFTALIGSENYEMRVADDLTWIDRGLLARLRQS